MSAAMFMRYDPEIYKEDRVRMEPDQDGDYIKFIDAQVEIDRLKALNAELAEALEMLFGENALQSVCTHEGQDAFGRVKGTWGAKAEAKARAALAKHKGEAS